MATRYRDGLLVLFVFSALAFNYPLLALFDRLLLPFGMPLLYLYLYGFWLVLIAVLALWSRMAGRHGADDS